jgi:hypothetical protein
MNSSRRIELNRRAVLKSMAVVLALLPFRSARLLAQAAAFEIEHAPMLKEIAAAVLPESLGRTGTDALAGLFGRWLTEYRAGATMDHGYGATRVQQTPPLPFDRYARQMTELDRAAVDRGAVSFAALPLALRRSVITDALRAANLDTMPQRPNGQHIVTDLMTFYFRSNDANDLCHRAKVQRHACRGLRDALNPPPPL